MSDVNPTLLEHHYVGADPWRDAVYNVIGVAAFGLVGGSILLFVYGRIGPGVFFLTLAILGLFLYVMRRWIFSWTQVTYSHKLVGSKLILSKSRDGKKPLRDYRKEYDLDDLWAAQEIEPTLRQYPGQVIFQPSKLVLILDSRSGTREYYQVTLNHSRVRITVKDEAEITRELDAWNQICAAIQGRILPQALARRWPSVSSYDRYWFVVLQAELEFLRGRCTARQMCLATLRIILRPLRKAGMVLLLAIAWLGLVAVVAFVLDWFGVIFLLIEGRYLKPGFDWFILLVPLVALVFLLPSLFRPLSARLQRDIPIRASQAKRLIEGGLTMGDLDRIRSFLKHEIERVRHTLTTLTVATAAPAVLSLMSKFTGSSSRAFDVILIASLLTFAIVQLYYYAQIQILHLAETNCLIAQSELQKEVP